MRSEDRPGDVVRHRLWGAVWAVLVLGLLIGCGTDDSTDPAAGAGEAPAAEPTADQPVEVTLYFPAASGLLGPEVRPLALAGEVEQQAQLILGALLEGPRSEGLARLFDEDTRLGGIWVDPRGVAYVDLVSADWVNPPPSGSRLERQRVYGVVNTLVFNLEAVEGVVLLWNGRQRTAFAGHVDTGHVLTLDPSLNPPS